MVQAPTQTIYSMETVGEGPAIRYEVNIPNVSTLFAKPPARPTEEIEFVPVLLGRRLFDMRTTISLTLTSTIWRQPTRITAAAAL